MPRRANGGVFFCPEALEAGVSAYAATSSFGRMSEAGTPRISAARSYQSEGGV